ncbi:MAG: Uncharacterized protein CEN92_421, partial [Candidatus Berkelbacteria bacterium Licking1014_96]
MKNVLRFLILLGLATFLVGLNLSCKKTTPTETPAPSISPSQTPSEDNLTNLDPTSVQEQITANYNTAKQKTSSWKSDAVLYSASAKITSSLDFEDVIEYVISDSVEFLKGYIGEIGLLYLDSFDCPIDGSDPTPAQEHNLKEIR